MGIAKNIKIGIENEFYVRRDEQRKKGRFK